MFQPTKFPCKAYHVCLEPDQESIGVYSLNVVNAWDPWTLIDEHGQHQPARELHETELVALCDFLGQVRRARGRRENSLEMRATLVAIDSAVTVRIAIVRAMTHGVQA